MNIIPRDSHVVADGVFEFLGGSLNNMSHMNAVRYGR